MGAVHWLEAVTQFASTKALTAVHTNRRTIAAAMMMPITLRRFCHFLLLQPMVWNIDQKPCSRCRNRAMNHTIYRATIHQFLKVTIRR